MAMKCITAPAVTPFRGDFCAPSGHGLSGMAISDTGRNSADNVDGVYYRPLQKLINGTWYNVASI
ncbi:putative IS1 encoded protein [Shigella flexneri 6603-63]|nr:putative IS1 encoded protein [Shigella flexneri 6603-63]